jgi:hypothetical protein
MYGTVKINGIEQLKTHINSSSNDKIIYTTFGTFIKKGNKWVHVNYETGTSQNDKVDKV